MVFRAVLPSGKPAFFGRSSAFSSLANLDGTIVVYGVTRIALPSFEQETPLRATGSVQSRSSTFVAGPENRLAAVALERLLGGQELPSAEILNPLVLLGPSGTGKSFLTRGITRHWSSLLDHTEVEYCTAIDFARQLRSAREEGELTALRERITQLQLWVVEDLHRLPTSTFVQREFRDTLDELLLAEATIVITSQLPPATIPQLDAGLRDRLLGGLTLRLQLPGLEARRALLDDACSDRGLSLNAAQRQKLAQSVEGTAVQVSRALAEYELENSDNLNITSVKTTLTTKQIIAVVARYYSLTQAALRSAARRKSLVQARAVAIYLARTLTDLSYAQIGQALGRRDHSTVMHAYSSIETRLPTDANLQQDVEALKRILTAV